MTAVSLTTTTLVGMSLGPAITASFGGAFGASGDGLAKALATVSLTMGVLSAVMFASSRHALARQAGEIMWPQTDAAEHPHIDS